jgi:hypothetical protein
VFGVTCWISWDLTRGYAICIYWETHVRACVRAANVFSARCALRRRVGLGFHGVTAVMAGFVGNTFCQEPVCAGLARCDSRQQLRVFSPEDLLSCGAIETLRGLCVRYSAEGSIVDVLGRISMLEIFLSRCSAVSR